MAPNLELEQADLDPQSIAEIEQEKEDSGGRESNFDQQVIDPEKVDAIEDEKKRRRSGGASSSW